jgi:hypothetical protein
VEKTRSGLGLKRSVSCPEWRVDKNGKCRKEAHIYIFRKNEERWELWLS